MAIATRFWRQRRPRKKNMIYLNIIFFTKKKTMKGANDIKSEWRRSTLGRLNKQNKKFL